MQPAARSIDSRSFLLELAIRAHKAENVQVLASQWKKRHELHRAGHDGLLLRAQLVGMAGSRDPGPHREVRCAGQRSPLKAVGLEKRNGRGSPEKQL